MGELEKALQALDSIPASSVSYEEWIHIGMALKSEGFDVSVWDDWSRADSRYHSGECEKKWSTFVGEGWGVKTIYYLANQYGGYTPSKKWTFDDYLPAEAEGYEQIIADSSPDKDKPYQMAVTYLEALFEPDEIVGYVHSAELNEDRQKWIPANRGIWRKCEDIVKDLKKYRKLDPAFGTINEEAGAWIRINPLDGKGATDKNVTAYRYALVEADSMPIEDQKKLLINMRLPIKALVESGGKSVHAIVKIGAESEPEYKQRVSFLFNKLAEQSFIVDTANKNPSRLSRLPGAMRAGNCQRLLGIDLGCSSWEDWLDFVNGVDDDLPEILDFWEQVKNPPKKSPELIGGILREGNKMIITGESKAGKTCLSQELAVCIAEGKPWLGKFKCEQGKVLYMNLEVEEADLFDRFEYIYKANEWSLSEENCHNLHPWNLRGHAIPLDKLADKVIRRCRGQHYKAIILDPLYKVQQGDENSAEAIIAFCNALDRIAHETGAAVIYDHHHPKGSAGNRKVIDRGSGSGVFARDADAICDLSFLEPSKETLQVIGSQIETGEKPMQIAFVLRAFKDIEPINCFFKFPVHYIDSSNLLNGVPVEGSDEAHRQKSSKRSQTSEDRAEILDTIFNMCEENGIAKLSEMVDWTQGKPSEKTLRRYIKESNKYVIDNGYVKKQ